MTFNAQRVTNAVAGFFDRYGDLPTQVTVPASDFYAATRDGLRSILHDASEFDRELILRLQVIPVPGYGYLASDGRGRVFDYTHEEGLAPKHIRAVKRFVSAQRTGALASVAKAELRSGD